MSQSYRQGVTSHRNAHVQVKGTRVKTKWRSGRDYVASGILQQAKATNTDSGSLTLTPERLARPRREHGDMWSRNPKGRPESQGRGGEAGGLTFSDLGLSPKLLAILAGLKFVVPTPIQVKAIPIAVTGKDVIGIAQTGTGKTLAFVLPMLQQIAKRKQQGLIIVPTRELAMQVEEQLLAVGKSLGLRHTVLIGGASMGRQIEQIRRRPHIMIATPGRMIDHLQTRRLRLDRVGVLVLDEADRMLDMGFAPQIKRILEQVPKERQTMLFSATMPPEIVKIATQHMKLPVRVEIARSGTVAERVNQELFVVRKEDKIRLLEKLLGEYKGTVLVFSRTKYGAKKLCRTLKYSGHNAAEIHSNLSLGQRQKSMAGFKSGKYRVLVATDIAARGIDVSDIELVINYDLPDSPDDYVHRVGRTGRAGKGGHAISFIMPEQRGKVRMIERLVRQQLRFSPLPVLPAHRPAPRELQGDRRQYGNSRRTFKAISGYSRRSARRSPAVNFARGGRNQAGGLRSKWSKNPGGNAKRYGHSPSRPVTGRGARNIVSKPVGWGSGRPDLKRGGGQGRAARIHT